MNQTQTEMMNETKRVGAEVGQLEDRVSTGIPSANQLTCADLGAPYPLPGVRWLSGEESEHQAEL